MAIRDEQSEFKKQYDAQKVKAATTARAAAAKAAPRPSNESVLTGEIQRLRRENEILKQRALKAKNVAAGISARSNRMSSVPNHLVRDMAREVMDALNGK